MTLAAVQETNDLSRSGSSGCCCLSRKQSKRISPQPQSLHRDIKFIEVRPRRSLRILHLNSNLDNTFCSDAGTEKIERTKTLKNNNHTVFNNVNNTTVCDDCVISRKGVKIEDKENVSVNENGIISPSQISQVRSKGQMHRKHGETSPKRTVSQDQLIGCVESDVGIENDGYRSGDETDHTRYEQESTDINITNDNSDVFSNTHELENIEESPIENDEVPNNPNPKQHSGMPSSKFIAETSYDISGYGDVEGLLGINNTHNTIVDRDGEAVLFFIHGVGGSGDVWSHQLEYFSQQGYEIVSPDLIGHGFSSRPTNRNAYSFEEISLDLLEIFDKFSKKLNVVVGHSYGCSFAAVLARKRHKKVNKMILVSGGSPIPLAPQPGIFSMPACTLACIYPILTRGFRKSAFHANSQTNMETAFNVPSFVLKYTMNGQWWPDGGVEFHQWINVATLLIHGAQDKLVILEEEEEMLETIFGSKMEVIDEAGHMVMMEKPDEVNKIIQDFLLCNHQGDNLLLANQISPETQKRKPWLQRALSNSKFTPIEPKKKKRERPRSGRRRDIDRKGSTLSLKSVKSLPHDLVVGNLIH